MNTRGEAGQRSSTGDVLEGGTGKWEASVAEWAERGTVQIGVKQEMSGRGGHSVSHGVRGLCLHPKNRGVLGEVTRFRLMLWEDV